MMSMFREVAQEKAIVSKHPRAYRTHWTTVSAIPDAVYPYDPAVVRAIREFDPNVIPLFVRRAYKATTGQVVVRGFHAFASHRWNPSGKPASWTNLVLMPTYSNAPRPTHMDLHLEDRNQRKGDGLPGAYVPFDWRQYHGLRALYDEWTDKQKVTWLQQNDRAAQARRAREKAQARVEERWARHGHELKGHLSRLDKTDAERLIQKQQQPQRKIHVGPW